MLGLTSAEPGLPRLAICDGNQRPTNKTIKLGRQAGGRRLGHEFVTGRRVAPDLGLPQSIAPDGIRLGQPGRRQELLCQTSVWKDKSDTCPIVQGSHEL